MLRWVTPDGRRLLREHIVAADRARFEAEYEKGARDPVRTIEFRILGDDQIERWIESQWRSEFGPDSKPLCAFVTNLDITARKRAEMTRAERTAQLEIALEASAMGTWRYDLESGATFHDHLLSYARTQCRPRPGRCSARLRWSESAANLSEFPA